MDNNNTNNENKIFSKQKYLMNNETTSKINSDNINFVWDNICSSDEEIIKKMNSMLIDTYELKLNILNSLLKSNQSLPIYSFKDIIKFFDMISPLNNEYNMASLKWNNKIIEGRLFIQNSISKHDCNKLFYSKYINLIKKKMIDSKIDFNYFEFKLKRFNKIKDIVWVIDLKQFSN